MLRATGLSPKELGELRAHLLLLFGQGGHRVFEIARNDHLQLVAIKEISCRRKETGSSVLPVFDSCSKMIWVSTEWVMSSPLLASRTTKSSPFLDHHRQIIERHIGAGARVVETAVGVFLDGDGPLFFAIRFSSMVSPDLKV
jgi:hypothetical protein